MTNEKKIIKEFRRIKSLGFIRSNRKNHTGIGKTFEDYLGVNENNIKDSDFEGYEVKSHRRVSNSYITLFTKSPSFPKKSNSILREKFGAPEGDFGVLTFRTSVFHSKWNSFKNQYLFKIAINHEKQKIELLSRKLNSSKTTVECSWQFNDLQLAFQKLKSLFFVTAERKKKRIHEYFHYTNATIFNLPTFQNFLDLIDEGKIMIDIRLGIYSSGINKGKAHDHGTGFRIKSTDLSRLYQKVFDVQ